MFKLYADKSAVGNLYENKEKELKEQIEKVDKTVETDDIKHGCVDNDGTIWCDECDECGKHHEKRDPCHIYYGK